MSDEMSDETIGGRMAYRKAAVIKYLSRNEYLANSDVCRLFNVSAATANRLLRDMTDDGSILKVRKGRLWVYTLSV